MAVGRCWNDDIHLVAFNEIGESLVQTGFRFAVVVYKGTPVDVHNLALASFLPVVNPADDGHHAIDETAVVHAVGTMEVDCLRVVGGEVAPGVHQVVLVAEQSPHALLFACLVFRCHGLEPA